jgi:hypothetical protein
MYISAQYNKCLSILNYCRACECFKNLLLCMVPIKGKGHSPCDSQLKARSVIAEDLCKILKHASPRCGGCDPDEEIEHYCEGY